MKMLINLEKHTAVEYAVCEKLVEWFGDVSSITYRKRENNGYDILFDNKCVGTFNELITGIVKLFFDANLDSSNIGKMKGKLYRRLEDNKPIDVLRIARLIINNKVSYKTGLVYEQEEI